MILLSSPFINQFNYIVRLNWLECCFRSCVVLNHGSRSALTINCYKQGLRYTLNWISSSPYSVFPSLVFAQTIGLYGDRQNKVNKACKKLKWLVIFYINIVYNLRTDLVDCTLKTTVYLESGHWQWELQDLSDTSVGAIKFMTVRTAKNAYPKATNTTKPFIARKNKHDIDIVRLIY